MNNVVRTEYFAELFNLIEVYSFKRDLPIDDEMKDFFTKVKSLCGLLDLDFNTLKKEFNLLEPNEFT